MVEAAGEPTHQWALGGVVGGRGEDVIDAVVELIAVDGKYVLSMVWSSGRPA